MIQWDKLVWDTSDVCLILLFIVFQLVLMYWRLGTVRDELRKLNGGKNG